MRKPKDTRDVVKLADLAPRHEVRGGNLQRVFGAGSAISENRDNMALVRGGKPRRDQPPKEDVKGGRRID